MSRTRLVIGSLWALWPLGLLAAWIYYVAKKDGNWTRYLELFPFSFLLVAISMCGLYFLLGWPGSKWVLRGIAFVVGLYFLMIALLAGSHGQGDPFQWVDASIPLVLVGFAAFSVGVAHRA